MGFKYYLSKQSKAAKLIAALIVVDFLYELYLLYRVAKLKYGLWLMDGGDAIGLQFYVNTWTVTRPLFFSAVWLLALIGMLYGGRFRYLITITSLMIGLTAYLFSLPGLSFFITDIKQEIEEPLMRHLSLTQFAGYNEWDILRGILLLALIFSEGFKLMTASYRSRAELRG